MFTDKYSVFESVLYSKASCALSLINFLKSFKSWKTIAKKFCCICFFNLDVNKQLRNLLFILKMCYRSLGFGAKTLGFSYIQANASSAFFKPFFQSYIQFLF